ncbi:MAG: RDD family protein [Cyanobacteria bacterium SZAS LIN-2]|nr:RDD family protein [Cyanobacteria bacterium SZAS LIN-2]
MSKFVPVASSAHNVSARPTMNSSSKGGSGFDPELAAKIEALEKQQALHKRCPSCGASSTSQRLTCESCGNYFERGAEETIWDNPAAIFKVGGQTEEEQQLAALKSYLVKRIVAKAIDSVIVGSLIFMEFVGYFGLARGFNSMPQYAPLMLNILFWVMPVLVLVTVLGYQAAFEASPIQATPGKLAMSLYVVDADGKQMGSEALIFKAFLSSLPALGFAAVYLYFFMSRWRFGMQLDAISTAVLAISGVAFFVTFLSLHIILGAEKKRQTIPDLLSGTFVQER